jgi:hypothetical protein
LIAGETRVTLITSESRQTVISSRVAMEQAELARIKEQIEREVRDRFPQTAVARVEVLEHSEDPQVEPGQLLARVVFGVPDGDLDQRARAMEAVHDEHREAVLELRKELNKYPVNVLLQFVAGGRPEPGAPGMPMFQLMGGPGPGGPEGPGCDPVTAALTPVMARLGAEDLETLDTLITAGIATSRADAVRWTLARIRERPAYAQLRTHTRQIEDLKSQF